ncbi:YdcF family protein [Paenibacillus antri]|uniref:YdcF family protein n=1 Tax=Paenibacillus antri TaxID=2582848 RepID=A0A5R9G6K0_9BACL|nr:YdcF family protein [Paenibacillus antri]TLS52022.1 YdcF family protein [Paenibacillus antri]
MLKLLNWKAKLLLLLLAVVVCLVAMHVPLLSAAGGYLKLPCTAPPASDAIIVLGGEMNGERTRKGAELYREGVAPKVMLSDGTKMSWRTTANEEMHALAVQEGVPPEAILQEEKSRSTYENAVYTRELMEQLGYDSAVVVTSDWHAKRSRFIFEKVYKGSGIELAYCGTPDDRSDFDEWWKDGEKQQVVMMEWAKTLVYWAKYAF